MGDAAYECSDWCLTPYPGRLGKALTKEMDAFNFYQSQLRITIERTFGMLTKRFGLLWRAQTAPLDHVTLAVAAAIKIHNECVADSDYADGLNDMPADTPLTEPTLGADANGASATRPSLRRDEVCADISDAGLSRPVPRRRS